MPPFDMVITYIIDKLAGYENIRKRKNWLEAIADVSCFF